MAIDIRSQLVPLELLDIEKCTTVGKTVEQMENCAIGARMIGEAAQTIFRWLEEGKNPQIIFDDPYRSNEAFINYVNFFSRDVMRGRKSFTTSAQYARSGKRNPVIVVGHFLGKWQNHLFEKGEDESIFINSSGLTPPWVRDGYFKGFINADPTLAIPILRGAVWERLGTNPSSSGFADLLHDWSWCGGVGHQAAHGFETFKRMVQDPDCTVFLTMSGIITMAGMSGLISYMIDQGWIRAIAATGALIGHGFVEGVGKKHFKYDPRFDDIMMAEQKLNRIGTTVEPEENLDQVEEIMSHVLGEKLMQGGIVSPSRICYLIGEHLAEKYSGEISILRSAYEQNIPIFMPASPDSELGNDLLIHNWRRRAQNFPEVIVNHEIDSLRLVDIMTNTDKLGIFTLGGGTSRNYMQNGAPLVEIMNVRLNLGLRENKYFYGCRICPDEVFLEHLSGCTYAENGSWRKTDIEHGRFSEVKADYSLIVPIYVAAMKERSSKAAEVSKVSAGDGSQATPRYFICAKGVLFSIMNARPVIRNIQRT